jgi:hypothetical protein
MSLESVSSKSNPTGPMTDPTHAPQALGLAERVGNLGRSVLAGLAEGGRAVIGRPLRTLTAVVAYLGWKGVYDASAEAKKLVETTHLLVTRNDYTAVSLCIEAHCRIFVARHPLPSGTLSASCQAHLAQKLTKIVADYEIPMDGKIRIITQVQEDFLHVMAEATGRLVQDKDTGALERLGIFAADTLVDVKCCGAETHNQGKVVLKFVFSDNKEIIYKPRSMLPEATLCDKEDSVFQEAGFGTYEVVCREDEQGQYGYCEYLRNLKALNTMRSVEEVQQYMDRMVLLEKIGRALRLSDLHFQNIITVEKDPKVIDLEVYLVPDIRDNPIEAGVFAENGAANTFDPYDGALKQDPTNQIWFSDSLTRGKSVDFTYRMSQEHLEQIGVRTGNLDDMTFSPQMEGKIAAAIQALQEQPGRFVLISTMHLNSMLVQLDPQDSEQTVFIDEVRRSVEDLGFQYNAGAQAQIIQSVQQDILHNDVPIFFYDSRNERILYQGISIGTRAQPA